MATLKGSKFMKVRPLDADRVPDVTNWLTPASRGRANLMINPIAVNVLAEIPDKLAASPDKLVTWLQGLPSGNLEPFDGNHRWCCWSSFDDEESVLFAFSFLLLSFVANPSLLFSPAPLSLGTS